MNLTKKKLLLEKVKECAKLYESNLKNKNILFITQNKDKSLENFQVRCSPSTFQHLTGCYETIKGKRISAYQFYKDCLGNKILAQNLYLDNSFAFEKLDVLPTLMNIDKIARMSGEYFDGYGVLLQTQRLAGTTSACMGFVLDELNYYVPNTSLKLDIRKVTKERATVIAILKKEIKESTYKDFTYLKKGTDIKQIADLEMIDKEGLLENNAAKS